MDPMIIKVGLTDSHVMFFSRRHETKTFRLGETVTYKYYKLEVLAEKRKNLMAVK